MDNFAHTLIDLVRPTRAVRLSTNFGMIARSHPTPIDPAAPTSLSVRTRTRICAAYQ
jgi:hypothetical protein